MRPNKMEGTPQGIKRPTPPRNFEADRVFNKRQRIGQASSSSSPSSSSSQSTTKPESERQAKHRKMHIVQLMTPEPGHEIGVKNRDENENYNMVKAQATTGNADGKTYMNEHDNAAGDELESESSNEYEASPKEENVATYEGTAGSTNTGYAGQDIEWAIMFPGNQGRAHLGELEEDLARTEENQINIRPWKKVKERLIQDQSPLFISLRPLTDISEGRVCEFLSKVRHTIWRHLLRSKDGISLDRNMRPGKDDHQKLHPAIMSTCRDIYAEAYRVLYTENMIYVHSEDIYHLEGQWTPIPNSPALKIPKKSIWRHNPLGGIGKLLKHPAVENHLVREYDSPALDGYIEPHVFARFQHIVLLMPG